MNGVIITGMDMPKTCGDCELYEVKNSTMECRRTGKKVGTSVGCYERMKDCHIKSIDGLIEKLKEAKESRPKGDIAKPGLSVAIHIIKEYCEVI